MTVDLAQALINDETRDPFTLHLPNENLIPPPFDNKDNTEFGITHFWLSNSSTEIVMQMDMWMI